MRILEERLESFHWNAPKVQSVRSLRFLSCDAGLKLHSFEKSDFLSGAEWSETLKRAHVKKGAPFWHGVEGFGQNNWLLDFALVAIRIRASSSQSLVSRVLRSHERTDEHRHEEAPVNRR